MDTSIWTNDTYEIKIDFIAPLAGIVRSYGYSGRAFGISAGMMDILRGYELENQAERFAEFAHRADEVAIEALENLFEQEDSLLTDLPIQVFFPGVMMTFEIQGDEHELAATVHQVRVGPLQYETFIALLLPDEIETYQLERAANMDQ